MHVRAAQSVPPRERGEKRREASSEERAGNRFRPSDTHTHAHHSPSQSGGTRIHTHVEQVRSITEKTMVKDRKKREGEMRDKQKMRRGSETEVMKRRKKMSFCTYSRRPSGGARWSQTPLGTAQRAPTRGGAAAERSWSHGASASHRHAHQPRSPPATPHRSSSSSSRHTLTCGALRTTQPLLRHQKKGKENREALETLKNKEEVKALKRVGN